MAILAKKIHVTNSAGEEQTVNLYGTVAELAGATGYTTQLVDGQECYAPLVGTDKSVATDGRVQLSTGDVYAWGAQAPVPAYAYRLVTTAGSGTFTVPAGVTKLRVTCVGGGAGGCTGFVHPSHTAGATATTNVGGGATTFGTVSAAGGTSPVLKYEGKYSVGESCGSRDNCTTTYTYYYWIMNRSTGYHNGTLAFNNGNVINGGAAVPLTNYQGTQLATAGAGGYADCYAACRSYYYTTSGGSIPPYNQYCVHSGASGYRTVTTITVTPGQSIAYNVGTGSGRWYSGLQSAYQSSSWNSGGHGGAPGNTGAILIEWGEGIE